MSPAQVTPPIRIALVTRAFSWEGAGGGEVLVRLLAEGLARAGHDVHVVTADARGVAREAPFHLHLVPKMTAVSLRRALRVARPDVIDIHNMEGSIAAVAAARSLRIPSVVTVNSAWPTCLFADMYRPGFGVCVTCSVGGVKDCFEKRHPDNIGRRVPAFVGYLETRRRLWGIKRAQLRIVHSAAAKDLLVRNGVDAERIRVVPNFAESSFETAPRPEGELILYVGALTLPKGPDTVVRALAALRATHPDARLAVAGVGYMKGDLVELAKRLDVESRVDLLGYVPHERVRDLYATARVVVFPSRSEEAFGRIVLEAWGAGVPIVASRVSAPGEVVTDGIDGLLFDPEDSGSLAAALRRLLDDPALAAKLTAAGRASLERYAPAEVIPRFVDVYREAMA